MIVTDLKQFGLQMKLKLLENPTPKTADIIVFEIRNATYANGNSLTLEDKEHIVNYIEFPDYDHNTGHMVLHAGDNSEFLKLVALISKSIKVQQ